MLRHPASRLAARLLGPGGWAGAPPLASGGRALSTAGGGEGDDAAATTTPPPAPRPRGRPRKVMDATAGAADSPATADATTAAPPPKPARKPYTRRKAPTFDPLRVIDDESDLAGLPDVRHAARDGSPPALKRPTAPASAWEARREREMRHKLMKEGMGGVAGRGAAAPGQARAGPLASPSSMPRPPGWGQGVRPGQWQPRGQWQDRGREDGGEGGQHQRRRRGVWVPPEQWRAMSAGERWTALGREGDPPQRRQEQRQEQGERQAQKAPRQWGPDRRAGGGFAAGGGRGGPGEEGAPSPSFSQEDGPRGPRRRRNADQEPDFNALAAGQWNLEGGWAPGGGRGGRGSDAAAAAADAAAAWAADAVEPTPDEAASDAGIALARLALATAGPTGRLGVSSGEQGEEKKDAERVEALLASLRPTLGAGVSDLEWAAASKGLVGDVLGVVGELEAAKAAAADGADAGKLRAVAEGAGRLPPTAAASTARAAAVVAANPFWPAAAKESFMRGLARAMDQCAVAARAPAGGGGGQGKKKAKVGARV